MAQTSLARKLLIKPGHRVAIINAPPGYMAKLAPLPEGAQATEHPEGTFDVVQLFARDTAELNRLAPTALASLKPDGVLWISYPKRSSKIQTDLTRDAGWEMITQTGRENVTQVAINDVWSAGRFMPADRVVKRSAG